VSLLSAEAEEEEHPATLGSGPTAAARHACPPEPRRAPSPALGCSLGDRAGATRPPGNSARETLLVPERECPVFGDAR
jgi:hypothetical protein